MTRYLFDEEGRWFWVEGRFPDFAYAPGVIICLLDEHICIEPPTGIFFQVIA